MKIEDIDKNFVINDNVKRDDIVWYDVRQADVDLYGFCEADDATRAFHRVPDEVALATNEGIPGLSYHTAGGRVKFTTDSPFLAILCECRGAYAAMPHMPLSGSNGFDIYEETDRGQTFVGAFFPPNQPGADGYSGFKDLPLGRHGYVLNFPLYGTVKSLRLGIQKGSVLTHGRPYRQTVPVVFYGSSITQGGCASRPGMCYQAHLSNAFDFDYVNLGFSGCARGEKAMVDYLASLPMSVFVCDYDHNAPTLEHLQKTLFPLYEAVRDAHPDIPYIFASAPGLSLGKARRDYIRSVYEKAKDLGDKNVYFVDGEEMFAGEFSGECTMEGCHPNDLGFYRMYLAFARVFEKIFPRAW